MPWRIALPRGAAAVPIARAMVQSALQDLRATVDQNIAMLLTDELVSNALKHGTDPIELVVELQQTGCRIEVHDDDPMLIDGLLGDLFPRSGLGNAVLETAPYGSGPARAAEDSGTEGGATAEDGVRMADRVRTADDHRAADDRLPAQCTHGLPLLRSLSADWGCHPTPHSKTFWFTLPGLQRRRRQWRRCRPRWPVPEPPAPLPESRAAPAL
ncbi:ATP-binding protein [Streptomyces sp. NBC_01456]|uniref:ATP-binding protein n=1 Tax=unclassified Streptomyces TaxID=2593676 RepID=UPI003FCEA72C